MMPDADTLRFSFDFVPRSLKNRPRMRRRKRRTQGEPKTLKEFAAGTKDGTPFPKCSAEAETDMAAIRLAAQAACPRTPRSTLFGDDDVVVTIAIQERPQRTLVTVRRTGPRPKGRADRVRDVHGVIETVMDALQGVVFDDDRQARSVTGCYGELA